MTRVKGGTVTNRKHKKILSMTKGFWMSRHKQIKKAKEAVLHAGQYAYMGRKLRKRDIRKLWISRINSALTPYDLKYSRFIHLLKTKHIELDRKILSSLALDYPNVFKSVVDFAKKK